MKIKATKDDAGKGFGLYWVFAMYSLVLHIQFWNVEITIWIPIKER